MSTFPGNIDQKIGELSRLGRLLDVDSSITTIDKIKSLIEDLRQAIQGNSDVTKKEKYSKIQGKLNQLEEVLNSLQKMENDFTSKLNEMGNPEKDILKEEDEKYKGYNLELGGLEKNDKENLKKDTWKNENKNEDIHPEKKNNCMKCAIM